MADSPAAANPGQPQIDYSLEGKSGPLLAGFHGTPGSIDQIFTIMDKMGLAPPRCRRLAVNRAGYCDTPLDKYRTIAEQADLFAELLDSLDIDKIDVIVAFSGGAMMALEFAKRHPLRVGKLLLLSAITGAQRAYNSNWHKRVMFTVPGMNAMIALSYLFPDFAIKSTISFMSTFNSAQLREEYRKVIASPADRDFLLRILRLNYPFKRLRPGFANEEKLFPNADIENYARLKLPILLLHGRYDADVAFRHAEELCRRVESASLLTFKKGYHLLTVGERFEKVKEKVLAFCGL